MTQDDDVVWSVSAAGHTDIYVGADAARMIRIHLDDRLENNAAEIRDSSGRVLIRIVNIGYDSR